MTGPLPPWLDRHENEALRLEEQATRAAASRLRQLVTVLARRIAAAWVRTTGGLDQTATSAQQAALTSAVAAAALELEQAARADSRALTVLLTGLAAQGLALGADQAAALAGTDARRQVPLPDTLTGIVDATTAAVLAAVRRATTLSRTVRPTRHADTTVVVAAAHRAVTAAETGARSLINRSIAAGVAAVAEQEQAARIWITERDACLTCLAYAGEIAEPGQPFEPGLTFGDRSTVTEPLDGPPAHPNCRCRQQLWIGADRLGIDLPVALKREAARAVLRGTSGHASEPAKVRAADRLLHRPALILGIPESIKTRARADVRRGRMTPPRRRTTTRSR